MVAFRGSTLFEIVRTYLAVLVPDFAAIASKTYPDFASAEEAIAFAWDGLFWATMNSPCLVQSDVQATEDAIQRALRAIVDAVRNGDLIFDAVHPSHYRRFNPDPALLEHLTPRDRVANRITSPDGKIIIDLRFHQNSAHDESRPQPPPPPEQPEPELKPLSREDAIRSQLKQYGIITAGQSIPEQSFGKAVRKLAGQPDAVPPKGQPPRGWGDKWLANLARKMLASDKF
jgi:hypothetical protein